METNAASLEDEVLVLEVSGEDEARAAGAEHFGVAQDEVELNIVEEGKGFLGLFGKKLKVEVRPKYPKEQRSFITLLRKVLAAADLNLDVMVLSDGSVNLTGPDSRILLAGRQGEGLKSLDYIVNLMARNDGPVPHVRVDCEGYRRKREKELEHIAMEAAKEAIRTRRTVYLQPMSSWERRIIHLTLRESATVETHSIGFEPGRKVAIRIIGNGGKRTDEDLRSIRKEEDSRNSRSRRSHRTGSSRRDSGRRSRGDDSRHYSSSGSRSFSRRSKRYNNPSRRESSDDKIEE